MNFDNLSDPSRKNKKSVKSRITTGIKIKKEPGIKIPTSQFKTVCQWCETCRDIETHFYNSRNRKLLCSNCRKVSKLKETI